MLKYVLEIIRDLSNFYEKKSFYRILTYSPLIKFYFLNYEKLIIYKIIKYK